MLIGRHRHGSRAGASVAVMVMSLAWLLAPPASHAGTIEETAGLCAACHGETGIPQDRSTPIIWGQSQGYLYLQLRDYKRGSRRDEAMSAVVETLERDDMMALAAYFSQRPWPDLRQPAAADAAAARAVRASQSIGCTGCHLDQYQGDGTVPRLAGQSEAYLLRTMAAFRARSRGNNPGMSDLMNAAAEGDLPALAAYLAGR